MMGLYSCRETEKVGRNGRKGKTRRMEQQPAAEMCSVLVTQYTYKAGEPGRKMEMILLIRMFVRPRRDGR
jgi:hypothetical protein